MSITQQVPGLPPHLVGLEIPWGPIGEQVFKRYRHPKNPELADGPIESWEEAVIRAVDGNLGLVSSKHVEPGEREKLIEHILLFGIVPAGRHLSSSGMKGRQFLFNCHAAGYDSYEPSAHYTFTFDQLMQGGGVGSNYSNRYVLAQPLIQRQVSLRVVCREDHPNIGEFADKVNKPCTFPYAQSESILVEDSREGWVDALDQLLRTFYAEGNESEFVIDVSRIRSRGTPMKSSGGIASGPEPLVTMLVDVANYLNTKTHSVLSSLEAMTLDHLSARCVQAGGKRRSSRMAVKCWMDYDILEFINCKSKDGDHWTTNISVEIDNVFLAAYGNVQHPFHRHARTVMRAVVKGKRKNGEPGLWNIDKSREGEARPELIFCPNPCGEIALFMWENCNLGHVNLQYFARMPTRDVLEAFRLVARWLVRATFGDIPQPRQRAIVDENRRIGVGFLGYQGYLNLRGQKYSNSWNNKELIDLLAKSRIAVTEEAGKYADELGIPAPVKNTTLAPTGTISLGSGVPASAQAIFGAWFKRLVRLSKGEPTALEEIAKGTPHYPDPDAPGTLIFEYWCEDPLVTQVTAAGWDPEIVEGQNDVSITDCLRIQAMLQRVWADNAISFTINVPEDLMPPTEELERTIMTYLPELKGTTLFPDKSRANAPFQRLTKQQWDSYDGFKSIVQVEQVCVTGCPV